MSSSVGMMTFPTEWKNKNVPNHQPDEVLKLDHVSTSIPCANIVFLRIQWWLEWSFGEDEMIKAIKTVILRRFAVLTMV